MEDRVENEPQALPLPAVRNRCLGHGHHVGNWCERIATCARHQTISHIREPWAEVKPPMYRMCTSNQFSNYIAIKEA